MEWKERTVAGLERESGRENERKEREREVGGRKDET